MSDGEGMYFWQAMLDIVATYADKWQYQLNVDKSSVMMLGESANNNRISV